MWYLFKDTEDNNYILIKLDGYGVYRDSTSTCWFDSISELFTEATTTKDSDFAVLDDYTEHISSGKLVVVQTFDSPPTYQDILTHYPELLI